MTDQPSEPSPGPIPMVKTPIVWGLCNGDLEFYDADKVPCGARELNDIVRCVNAFPKLVEVTAGTLEFLGWLATSYARNVDDQMSARLREAKELAETSVRLREAKELAETITRLREALELVKGNEDGK